VRTLEDRRATILKAAQAVFAEKGYERATMDEIAATSQMSKATLYRYFAGKAELRDQLIHRLPEADLAIPNVRSRILEVAMDTIGRKGYSRTTLDDIAAGAGVSKGGIYWHFKGKDDLMAAIVAEYSPFPQVVAIVEGADDLPFEDVVRRIVDVFLEFFQAHGDFFTAIISEIQSNEELGAVFQRSVAQPLLVVVGGYLMRRTADAGFRQVHPVLALQSLLGPFALHVLIRPVLETKLGLQIDLSEVKDTLIGNFLDGIRHSSEEAGHAGSDG
jgi:AcrR family transcriptional regulator